MATPYLDEAERCARVALLHDGRLLALDRPGRSAGRACRAAVRGHRADRRAAAARHPGALPGVVDVQLFGERAHVRVAPAAAATSARRSQAALERAGLRGRQRPADAASLEDVFIDLIARQDDAAATPGLIERTHEICTAVTLLVAAVSRRRAAGAPRRTPSCGSRWTRRSRAAWRTSHRLAEAAGAAGEAPRRRGRPRTPRRCRRLRCAAATRAPTTSTSSASRSRTAAARHLSGHSGQLPRAARPAVADLHRRPPRRARARGRAPSASATGEDLGGGARRPAARDHARVLGARDRRSRPSGSLARVARQHRRARAAISRSRLDAGSHSAERGAVGRGAAVAPAHAGDRGAQHARRSPKRICARLIGLDARTAIRAGRPRSSRRPVDRRRSRRCSTRRAQQRPERRALRRSRRARHGARATRRRPGAAAGRRRGGVDYARPEPADLSADRARGRTRGTLAST